MAYCQHVLKVLLTCLCLCYETACEAPIVISSSCPARWFCLLNSHVMKEVWPDIQ